jgi:hypothetical protein
MNNMKKTGVEYFVENINEFNLEQVTEYAKFIERENMLDFALFVKREGWALKTGKNIDDLYNDFLNK